MNILKIYIIEDDTGRIYRMNKFFEKLERDLKDTSQTGKLLDYLRTENIEAIEPKIIEPLSSDEEDNYYNYKYEEIKNKLANILEQTDEKRIFLLDLALNNKEREIFSKNNDKFLAKTASKIINDIATYGKQENILINTRAENIEKRLKSLIMVSEKELRKVNIRYIAPNIFASSNTTKKGRESFYDAINGCLNDMGI